jgi:arylsulfatase A-like enzyme
MNRILYPRFWLAMLSAWSLASWVVLGAADSASDKPNIILLLTDDQRDNTLGAMGHPFVQTPHLDALMRDSVRFKNTYTATPVCSPSRVSFFTGMPERVHGVGFSSSYDLTEQQWEQTYPALLRKSGYFTGFVGKFGVEYYAFKGRAAEKFDFWWGHDGWTKFLPKEHDTPSTTPYHHAKADIITPIMGEAMTKFLDTAPGDNRSVFPSASMYPMARRSRPCSPTIPSGMR